MNPRVGAAVIVQREDRVLLVRRRNPPNEGLWVPPGGRIEFGEPWRHAAEREVREETGLEIAITVSEVPYVLEILGFEQHRIILYARALIMGGNLKAASDATDARFLAWGELWKMDISPPVMPVLEHFRPSRRRA